MTVVAIVMFSSGAGSGCPSPWRGMVIGTFVGALLTATLTISVATYDVLSDVGRLLGGA
jgi:high-affinity Fe2+/Pb2+ permease